MALRYRQGINHPDIVLPQVLQGESSHVWHLFVIRTLRREALQQHLTQQGVGTLIHYPIAPHQQQAYAAYQHLNLPLTEQIHQEVLSLPIDPTLSDASVQKVIDACNEFN